jgi:hypothetical protein
VLVVHDVQSPEVSKTGSTSVCSGLMWIPEVITSYHPMLLKFYCLNLLMSTFASLLNGKIQPPGD